jgi:metal-responsive CopG/Arc/MetJ family transcriptional regulator
MAKYSKKIQVLLTEQQLKELEEVAHKSHKKLGTLVREAIEEYHLKKNKQQKIAEAVDRLLSLPEVPAPEDYQKWEAEYLEGKYSCR